MHSLYTLWKAFFDICRLRIAPQNLPISSVLLGLTLLFYTFISMTLSLTQLSLKDAMLSSIVDTSLLVVLPSSLLYIAHYPARIPQTLTAIAGTNCILGILTFPLVFWLKFYDGQMTFLALLLLLSLIGWGVLVYAHILRHALNISFFLAVMLTMFMNLLTFNVLAQIVPFAK